MGKRIGLGGVCPTGKPCCDLYKAWDGTETLCKTPPGLPSVKLYPAGADGFIIYKKAPTDMPTVEPTQTPTDMPTVEPTQTPTDEPSAHPTLHPSSSPSLNPTTEPSQNPTVYYYEEILQTGKTFYGCAAPAKWMEPSMFLMDTNLDMCKARCNELECAGFLYKRSGWGGVCPTGKPCCNLYQAWDGTETLCKTPPGLPSVKLYPAGADGFIIYKKAPTDIPTVEPTQTPTDMPTVEP